MKRFVESYGALRDLCIRSLLAGGWLLPAAVKTLLPIDDAVHRYGAVAWASQTHWAVIGAELSLSVLFATRYWSKAAAASAALALAMMLQILAATLTPADEGGDCGCFGKAKVGDGVRLAYLFGLATLSAAGIRSPRVLEPKARQDQR